jgi:uncharacterized protein (DUF362 family)
MSWNRRKFLKSFAGALGLISGHKLLRLIHRIPNFSAAASSLNPEGLSRANSTPIFSKPTVVQIRDKRVTNWDGITYPYIDSIDQSVVNQMLDRGLEILSGKSEISSAWRSIVPYHDGDKVAIKPNFNDLFKYFHYYVVAPQVINAVLRGLIELLRVPPKDIILYDVSRLIPDIYRERIHYKVTYVEPYGSSISRKFKYHLLGNPLAAADPHAPVSMRANVKNKNGQKVQCFLPKILSKCKHLINVPIFKSHQFVLASGALKNHYGTVRFSDGHIEPEYLHPPIINQCIADLNAHPTIQHRTRLIVMDAIFGRAYKKHGPPDLQMSSLFISRDPVALDSVTSSLIAQELIRRGDQPLSDQYLHLASKAGLGVHERKDPAEKYRHIDFRKIDVEAT